MIEPKYLFWDHGNKKSKKIWYNGQSLPLFLCWQPLDYNCVVWWQTCSTGCWVIGKQLKNMEFPVLKPIPPISKIRFTRNLRRYYVTLRTFRCSFRQIQSCDPKWWLCNDDNDIIYSSCSSVLVLIIRIVQRKNLVRAVLFYVMMIMILFIVRAVLF